MRKLLPFLLILTLIGSVVAVVVLRAEQASAAEKPPIWPQQASDIATDAKATFGKLDNGLRYVIYPNAEPPGRVSVRMHINAGSLSEQENQRGLAHFLEHMVFNGSKNYKASELIPKMQRLGISFGAHANAFTSFDQTVYMLDLPNLEKDTLDLAFTVMRDFGDGALLDAEAVDAERGVIMSEKRSRDSISMRLMEKQFQYLLPNSLIPQRFPIGTEEVINTAPRERLVEFYQSYYYPSNMVFVVVGDIDVKVIEERIKTTFGSMEDPAKVGPKAELGKIAAGEGLKTAVFADRELGSTDLSLVALKPYEDKPDTVASRKSEMPLDLANAMLERRFVRITQEDGSPITAGGASRSEFFKFAEFGSIDVTATEDRWEEALPVLAREFSRVLAHGFNEDELAEAKANILNAYEQAVKAADSRQSPDLASGIVSALHDAMVLTTPQEDLRIVREGLEKLTAADAHAAFKKFWGTEDLHLILTTKEQPQGAESRMAELFTTTRKAEVTALAARSAGEFAYTQFGTPGKVRSRTEVADLAITQVVFENGVRVNLKTTEFERNNIRLNLRFGSGKLTQPLDMPGLDTFISAVYDAGGLGKHSADDLQGLLAGRNVSSSFGIAENAFTLGGRTTPDELTLQLQLMAAYLTDPGFRPEALRAFRNQLPVIYKQLEHSEAGPQAEMQAWLHGDDPRFTFPKMEVLAAYTPEDAQKWLAPARTNGYLEVSLVGDFKTDAAIEALAATFGALPPREEQKPALDEARVIKFPATPAERVFTFESEIPKGTSMVIWDGPGMRDNISEFRRLNIVAEILSNRLREEIREKLGAAYSPYSGASGSDTFNDLGYIIAVSPGKPEDATRIGKLIREIGATFAAQGATADELDRAIKPVISGLQDSLRENSYWLGTVLSQSQEDPKRLDYARKRDEDYKSITLEEINALAAKYLTEPNSLRLEFQPKK
jgi:zinc protease